MNNATIKLAMTNDKRRPTMTTTNNDDKDERRGQTVTTDNDERCRRRQPTMKTNNDNNEEFNLLVFDRIVSHPLNSSVGSMNSYMRFFVTPFLRYLPPTTMSAAL
jgi:hypothetical protein